VPDWLNLMPSQPLLNRQSRFGEERMHTKLSLEIRVLLLIIAFGSISATNMTGRNVFEDFGQVVYLLPNQSGNYWAIPNGDSVQYFGSQCDPENTACILSGTDSGGTTYARLQIGHDASPAGYDNADLAGIPSGTTSGSGDQLWCASLGHPVTMEYRVRWSSDYSQLGLNDVAVGSSGFGAWNNPVMPDYALGPVTSAFFQWVDGFGLSTVATKAIGNQTTILSFTPVVVPVTMQDWNQFKIEIVRLVAADEVKFFVKSFAGLYVLVNTAVVPGGLGCCLSMENWNDMQAYDLLMNTTFQNLPAGETQAMDIDWYLFSQP
jgi:hypothetical protein